MRDLNGIKEQTRHTTGGQVKTRDLWQSAYLLTRGGELTGVEVGGNGSRVAVFIFAGPEVKELAREFQSGQAVCNVTRLRASMIHLKEVMFSRIRD